LPLNVEIDGGEVSVDHLVGTSEQRRRHVEAEGLCRLGGLSECARTRTGASSQKQPVFHTLNPASKMARFAGFLATLFRGVFSYSFYMGLMSAFGAKRTSQGGREHVDKTRMTQSGIARVTSGPRQHGQRGPLDQTLMHPINLVLQHEIKVRASHRNSIRCLIDIG